MQHWLQTRRRDWAQSARRGARGMTLVEIMVVVVIIAMVTSIVGVAMNQRLEKAKTQTAKIQIRNLSDALDLYKLSLRHYPSTAEGLQALVTPKGNEGKFIDSVPVDPWGNEYVYISPGVHNQGGFDLMSYGPDAVQGGGDDIGNWEQGATP